LAPGLNPFIKTALQKLTERNNTRLVVFFKYNLALYLGNEKGPTEAGPKVFTYGI
jgi:hypothetical protein